MKKLLTTALAIALACMAVPSLSACTGRALAANDLMDGIEPAAAVAPDKAPSPEAVAALAVFSLDLFRQSAEEENVLLSPLSAACALGMTANGAGGQTLAQMECVLGLPLAQLNSALAAWRTADPDENGPLHAANSIWLKNGLAVKQGFLQANADFYEAGALQAPFDASTKDDINQWVCERTGGMVDAVVDDVPAGAALYLVNAMAIDAKWQSPYEPEQVFDGTFTAESGKAQAARMMRSTEGRYLEDEGAVGFVKPYEGGDYAFVALLPYEGTTIADYAAGLDGRAFLNLLENAQYAAVEATLPKFEHSFGANLGESLRALGMADAFDGGMADFTGIADRGPNGENLFVDCVLHKTFVSMDEKGTKAAAASAVGMAATAADPGGPEEMKVVRLDRPFFYAIIDTATNLPVFLGSVTSLEG